MLNREKTRFAIGSLAVVGFLLLVEEQLRPGQKPKREVIPHRRWDNQRKWDRALL
jgi:hypothetical protein